MVQNSCLTEGKKSCSPKKEIFIFSKGKELLFQGMTNIPFVYFEEPIGVGFLSSKGIIYWLTKKKELHTGTLILKPRELNSHGKETEFARVEPEGLNITGFSQDIKSSKETQLTLLEGKYNLVVYSKNADGDRKTMSYGVNIKGGKIIIKSFPYYLSAKKKKTK